MAIESNLDGIYHGFCMLYTNPTENSTGFAFNTPAAQCAVVICKNKDIVKARLATIKNNLPSSDLFGIESNRCSTEFQTQ